METLTKEIMEHLNKIEQEINDEAEVEHQMKRLHELEIRQQMRIDHAEQLLKLGVDAQKIGRATGLRADFIERLKSDGEKQEG